ncbi:MAG: AarF/ABC1/UbiB kinase family protein [Alphaproteobacteria bacterium]|nr:AarF/ABC1/UbiB kinase family protein [Alphaproteobacteria bacterium]
MSDKKPSRLGRLAELGSLTGRVTAKYVREQVKQAVSRSELGRQALDKVQLENALDIAETMGRLKGAAMKIGQQAAMFADNLDLPPEVGRVLGKLHAEAQPVPFDQIREDVEASLEHPLGELFASVDPEPLGTASLAQAHAATLPDGREVVIKVLHRGVEGSVETDLLALRGIMLSSRALARSRHEIDEIFAELRDRLLEELDYLQEAANLATYARLYGGDPRVRIPTVHTALSTEKVLVLDRLPGVHIDRFLETATPEARQRAGTILAEIYYEQVFQHRTLHCDPHPGNYLFEPDGRVGILDFGAVRRFDEHWVAAYASVALAALADDKEGVLAHAVELGAWDGRKPAAGDALWAFVRQMVEPFGKGPLRLGGDRENFLDEMKPVIRGVLPYPSITAPRPLVMLHRSLAGMYALSRRLEAEVDYGALISRNASLAVARARGALPTDAA